MKTGTASRRITSTPRRSGHFKAFATSAVAAALGFAGCSSSGSDGHTTSEASGTGGDTGESGGGASTTTTTTTSGSGGTASGGATGTSTGGSAGSGGTTTTGMGTVDLKGGPTTAHDALTKLGKTHFLIGMGNDLNNNHDQDGAFTLGTGLDLHYAYLVGLKGQGGWPDWNAGGTFVNVITDSSKKHGDIPMFTLYSMAAKGENNTKALTDDTYMKPYWDGAKLMFQRLAVFGDPSIVQFEPDWWGYAEQASPGGDPSKLPVHVTTLAPDCKALPNTMVGMGQCLITLARLYSPKTIIGFHASQWANGDISKIVTFLKAIGSDATDFVTTDTLDRDAGCYEAHTDPNCQRTSTGVYWDESNQTSPDFHDHLAFVKTLTTGMGKPMLWWQTPFGVPSSTPGGTSGKYRDNRVHYIFSHIDEFVAAGGMGVAFGTGAGNQTYIDSDNDEFKTAVAKYFAAPTAL